jgi:hypothetical protein
MRRLIMALTFASVLATTALVAQRPQQPDVPLFTKAGWWIRVDTQKTEASSITLQIGTKAGDRRAWRAWHSGEVPEFDVPGDFQSAKEIYIQASSNPSGKTTRFCVFFQSLGMKRFDFSGDKDEQIKQTDRDDTCH